ncbi:BnaAnng10810D [Brassica napus]|uniref:BnaAnng10810D protein n=1 Tax=Brassica napus TaxID=3708 RepID=A0A078INR7_BRANA|nr:BnaAnng10810D [Brassica napus]
MVRCFLLHDVYSQPQQSSRQRRQQILTEGIEEDDLFDFSDNDGDDIPQHNVPQTQENEEIYRVNLSADTLPSHEYTHDSTRLPSRRGEERTRRGGRSERTGGRGSTSQTISMTKSTTAMPSISLI